MLHTFVSFLDDFAGCLLGDALPLPADHPTATAVLLAGLAGAAGAVWVDAVARRS